MRSRRRLNESSIEALGGAWAEHGRAAIATVREIDPATYVKIVAAVCRDAEDPKPEGDPMDLVRRLLSGGRVG